MRLRLLLVFPMASSGFVAPIPPQSNAARFSSNGVSWLLFSGGLPNEIKEVDFAELYNENAYQQLLEPLANVSTAQAFRKVHTDLEETQAKLDEQVKDARETEQQLLKEKDDWKLAFHCLNHYATTGSLTLRLDRYDRQKYEKLDFTTTGWDGKLFDSCLAKYGLLSTEFSGDSYGSVIEMSLIDFLKQVPDDDEDAPSSS